MTDDVTEEIICVDCYADVQNCDPPTKRICPFAQDVKGEELLVMLCDRCYKRRSEEI